jgi:hypothetical protein
MISAGKIDPAISKKLAQEIRAIAKRAQNEEEVRIPVETALKPVLAQLGISAQPSYEQKLTTLQGTGYADAVYGFGVIETEAAQKKLESLESEIDKTAAELWSITAVELGDIQSSLADLQ